MSLVLQNLRRRSTRVKQAIESTGVTLCNLSQPGNLTERLFGISTTGDCPGESGGGIVYIFTETTQAAAHSDLAFARNNAKTNGDSVWVDHTIIVDDESAAPGTNTALKAIGFKRG